MSTRPSMLRSALQLTGTNIFLRGVSMAFQVWLSRRLGAAGLGLLQLVLTVGYFAMTLGSAGIRTASMYLTAQQFGRGDRDGVQQAVRTCLLYALVLSAAAGTVLVFSAEFIAVNWLADVRAAQALRLTGIFLPGCCLCAVLSGYVIACGKVKALIVTEIAERFLGIGITAVLLMQAQGELGSACSAIVAGSSGSALFTAVVLYIHFRREFPRKPVKEQPMGGRLLQLCVPLAANDVLRSGLSTVEQLLIPAGLALSATRGQGLAAYGTVQGMVFPLLMFPAVLLYALSDLLVPELSKCRACGKEERVRALTGRCLRMGLLFAAVTAGFFYCTADAFGQLLYYSTQAGDYLKLFAPTLLFLYTDALVDGLHKGLGQQVHCVRYNTLTAFLDVVFLWLLLPKLGMGGYLISFTLTHLLNFFLSIRRLLVVTALAPSALQTARLLCGTVLCCAAAELLPINGGAFSELCCKGSVFLTAMFFMCRAFKILEKNDLEPVRMLLKFPKPATRTVDKKSFVG